jgi:hypothetical protein
VRLDDRRRAAQEWVASVGGGAAQRELVAVDEADRDLTGREERRAARMAQPEGQALAHQLRLLDAGREVGCSLERSVERSVGRGAGRSY